MRPQQNRRMRGRGGGNNRKSPNPLTRSYESNGPDVKIRGTAQQVAEKYTTLARDAQSSGDRVMAENYLQHAEHYNRLIAAAQLVQNQQSRSRDDEEDDRESQESSSAGDGDDRGRRDEDSYEGAGGPQPVFEGVPAEVAYEQGALGNENPKNSSSDARMNGSGEHEARGEEGEQAPRRARRPRRARAKADEGDAAGSEGKSGSEMADAIDN